MKRLLLFAVALTFAALGLSLAYLLAPHGIDDHGVAPSAEAPAPSGAKAEAPGLAGPKPIPGARSAVEPADTEPVLIREEAGRIAGIVVDRNQVPVPAADVELLYGTEPSGLSGLVSRRRVEASTLAAMQTGANGGFSFEAPAGFWSLRVTKEGMAPFEEEALRPGDFRWIELGPSSLVPIRTVDPKGVPIADVELRVIRGTFTDPEQARMTRRTGGAGEATLRDVPAGSWSVRAEHGKYLTRVVPLMGTSPGSPALRIVMQPGITIEGSVALGANGTAAGNASVHFDSPNGLATSHTVRCRPDGTYSSRLPFPRGSVVEVSTKADGYGELRQEVRIDPPRETWTFQHDVVLECDERTAIGRVVSKSGAPLSGVEVFAHPLLSLPAITTVQIPGNDELRAHGAPDLTAFTPKASPHASRWRTATTDADGYFRTRSLHPARAYELLFLAEGKSNRTLWLETGQPGATFDFGTIELERPGRVTGYVRRADGSGIDGAQVYAVESPTHSLVPNSEFKVTRSASLAAGLEAYTNASGFFSIEPFPRKPFRLMCKGVIYGPFEFDADGELAELELVATDLHRRATERSISMNLSVTDHLGQPVPKAYVEVQRVKAETDAAPFDPLNHWEWATGNASGDASVHLSSAGRYAVTAKDIEGLLESSTIFVDVGNEPVTRKIQLAVSSAPAGLLEGTVLSHVGEPLANMEVTLIPVTGATSCGCMKFKAVTDADGLFSFGHFMEGQHRIVVADPSGRLAPGQLYPAVPGQLLSIRM